MTKRTELIQPIQKRVFAAIEAFAKSRGYDLVLDAASNPTLLYSSAALDQTQAVIATLK
jgi:outer membrane protein